jgi:hypothetical protein
LKPFSSDSAVLWYRAKAHVGNELTVDFEAGDTENNYCMLAFKGSDSADDAIHDLAHGQGIWSMVASPQLESLTFGGKTVRDLNSGIKNELLSYLNLFKGQNAFDFIKEKCDSAQFVTTGHSLGGAMSQAFSVWVNKGGMGDNFEVNYLYSFGGLAISTNEESRGNDKTGSGPRFKGSLYYNARTVPWYSLSGKFPIDVIKEEDAIGHDDPKHRPAIANLIASVSNEKRELFSDDIPDTKYTSATHGIIKLELFDPFGALPSLDLYDDNLHGGTACRKLGEKELDSGPSKSTDACAPRRRN